MKPDGSDIVAIDALDHIPIGTNDEKFPKLVFGG
jgi:hypothetical protein